MSDPTITITGAFESLTLGAFKEPILVDLQLIDAQLQSLISSITMGYTTKVALADLRWLVATRQAIGNLSSPSLTREEGMRLLDEYQAAQRDFDAHARLSSMAALDAATEACLKAMGVK